MTHYSLAHPDKTFELWNGARESAACDAGGTLRERVFQVFGSQMLEDLIDLGTQSRTLPPA